MQVTFAANFQKDPWRSLQEWIQIMIAMLSVKGDSGLTIESMTQST